jgi:hypothetical protein
MKVHELKCEEPHWSDIRAGRKRFELRSDDRGYEVGDILELTSWSPITGGSQDHLETEGQKIRVEVLHILHGERFGAYGLKPTFCCMSIRLTGDENVCI